MPLPTIPSGNVFSSLPTGFSVDNSCRFNDGDSAYLTHTHGAVTSTRKQTFSFWVKRGTLAAYQYIISTKNGTSTDRDGIAFDGSDQIDIRYGAGSSSPIRLTTNRVFRDCSAFYHIVVAVDTEQGTAANRIKLYVNGTQETSFATSDYMDADYDFALNAKTDQATGIGIDGRLDGSYFDGYMSEFVAIDGTQNAVTDFGEFDEDSPTIWKPINVSGLTFGNAGFYMNFQTSAELGTDVSGNSNTFTENNLAAADQATDTPTNNFATLNAINNFYPEATFSNGNLKITTKESAPVMCTLGVSSGKWYWEVKVNALASTYGNIGIVARQATAGTQHIAGIADCYGYYSDGSIKNSSGSTSTGYDTYTANDIIGIAMDLDNNRLFVSKNGTWQNSADPTTSTGAYTITAPASTSLGAYFPAISYWDDNDAANGTYEANFGGCPAFAISSGNADGDGYGNFEYAVPSGYYALCTKNLAVYG